MSLKNTKHELFCLEYLKDLNAAQAAIRAGYSKANARYTASRILAIAEVKTRIAELKEERLDQARIDANYVLNRLLTIDRLNVEDLLDDNGDLKDVKNWTEDWQTCIQALDIQVTNSGGVRTTTKKVRIPDRLRNLELLGKHIDVSAFKEKDADTVPNDVLELVIEVSTPLAKDNLQKLQSKLTGEK